MDLPGYLLFGLTIPVLAALLLLGLALRTRAGTAQPSSSGGACTGLLAALAIGLSSSLAWYLLNEDTPLAFPPRETQDWYFYLPVLGMAVAALLFFLPSKRFLPTLLMVLASGLMTWLLLSPLQEDWWTIIFVSLLVTAFWTSLEINASRLGSRTLLLQLCLLGSAGSYISWLGGSGRLALQGGSLSCILGSSTAFLFLFRGSKGNELRGAPGITAVAAILLSSLWINGPFYDDVPELSAILLVAAPCSSALVCRLRKSQPNKLSSLVWTHLPAVICVLTAVTLAMLNAEDSGATGY